MAERLKAAVLKTADREVRGFESLSLRQNQSSVASHQLILNIVVQSSVISCGWIPPIRLMSDA
jgi:hypothetical protein